MGANTPDEIYFPQFEHIIKRPEPPDEESQVIEVEALQRQEKTEAVFEEMLTCLKELSRAQQRQNAEPRKTSALYLGRRVEK